MTTDPYVILGLPQDAAPPAIRSSYKKLILQCHPDKVHDESLRAEKAIQFQRVQEAYELLIDNRRRRKYDDGVKNAAAAAAAGPSKSGGSGGQSSEERHRDRGGERERERGHGRSSRRREEDRRAREEPSSRHAEDPRESPRKSSSYRHQHSEPSSRSYDGHPHYPEEQPSRHKSYGQRYPEESPRKATYGSSSHHHKEPPLSSRDMPRHSPPQSARDIPRPPEPQPQPAQEAVRPGYLEMKAAEKAKLEGIRRKLTEETSGGMSDEAREAGIGEKTRERARLEKEKKERKLREEKEEIMREQAVQDELRRGLGGSGGLGRSTDVPPFRERKSSKSPPMRRGSSSTASRVGEDIPSTPTKRPAYVYGSSAPQHPVYPAPHTMNPNNSHGPRRRHSSPTIEKQAQRNQRDIPCDSGYSSPSTDTPLTDKKMPSPGATRTATEVHHGCDRSGNWKRYTFEVYVHEDEATAPGPVPTPQGPVPHTTGPLPHFPYQYQSRRAPGSTSPSSHPAEPVGGTLPPEFVEQVTGVPYSGGSTIDSRFGSPPSNHPHSPHSPLSTPPRPHARHHSHRSPGHSPRLSPETFTPPSVSRSHTYSTHSRRAGLDPRDPHYPGYTPGLARGATFS
ncbi:unnamed protein product [Tuber aestivum]|uniref:J domain-containing protein n=1 Tax=Tuber aestivum TaxID=59557 RepID=A0A292Q234_9PEZI|nr:unnamed protein product [Tuber aestivum]